MGQNTQRRGFLDDVKDALGLGGDERQPTHATRSAPMWGGRPRPTLHQEGRTWGARLLVAGIFVALIGVLLLVDGSSKDSAYAECYGANCDDGSGEMLAGLLVGGAGIAAGVGGFRLIELSVRRQKELEDTSLGWETDLARYSHEEQMFWLQQQALYLRQLQAQPHQVRMAAMGLPAVLVQARALAKEENKFEQLQAFFRQADDALARMTADALNPQIPQQQAEARAQAAAEAVLAVLNRLIGAL